MEILTPTLTDQLPDAVENPKGNTLRPAQMAEALQDIKAAKAQLDDPRVQDKGAVRTRLTNLQRDYDNQAPRSITDGRLKDKLANEAKQLLEEITPGMLSQEEMRKNPAGSVDKHMRWERANKGKIKRWKKLMTVLNADNTNPGTWDRDAANLEKFRPASAMDRLRTDAQINGHMSYGNITEENWAQAFGHLGGQNSALNQSKRVIDLGEPSTVTQTPDVKVKESSAKK